MDIEDPVVRKNGGQNVADVEADVSVKNGAGL